MDGALDDAEQIPRRIAYAMTAASCGPFVQHGLSQRGINLLQCHPGTCLLLCLQFREALGPLQIAQRAPAR